MSTFNETLQRLRSLPEEKRRAVLAWIKENRPENYEKLELFFRANPGAAEELQGYEHWLTKFGPHTFFGEFSSFHKDMWDWYWPVTQRQQEDEKVDLEDLTYLAIWGRGLGKSSNAEWLAIAEGCLVGKGFVLYVCHEIGTEVYTPELNRWHRVEEHPTARTVRRDGYRVRVFGLPDGETVTPEHQYWARRISRKDRGHGRPPVHTVTSASWICARDLNKDTWIGYPIDQTVAIEFPRLKQWLSKTRTTDQVPIEFDDPEWWWFFGLWWGDGTLGGCRRSQIGITVANKDVATLQRLRTLLHRYRGKWGEKQSPGCINVYFGNSVLARWLATWRVGDSRKQPPAWVERLPADYIVPLLQGYLDADGHLDDEAVTLTSIHLPGLHSARRMLMRIGIAGAISVKRKASTEKILDRTCNIQKCYKLSFARNAGVLGFSLPRYRASYRHPVAYVEDGYLWSRVRSVEPVTEATFIPITTATSTYLSAFGLSHNCGTAEQAESHVEAIRDRLETESVLLEMYPGMKKPSMPGKKGGGSYTGEHKQYGWRQDYLMTANGWAIRPVGLDKAIRGWKRGDSRVSMIILDDIDDDDDSPEVILKKERRISKKILPMGTARTKVVFAQNLIHSNSVLNRIHTRQTDILALRKGDVAIKSFEEIQIERGIRNVITSGTPTWPFIDMAECQSFLDRSGYDAFMAEYQHDFTGEQNQRVLPEYDDRVLRTNLITWSQYEALYKIRRIPSDWPSDVGLDIGFTTGHLSAWTFVTKAPSYAPLAGSMFRYRGRTFQGIEIGDQSVQVRGALWPGERLQREFSSHEGESERMTLNQKHGWYFQTCKFGKKDGVAQWRHYLKADKTKPHPFHRDEKQPDGLWKIGCPSWFDIVDDDQFISPRDDKGLKTHRNQAYNWKMRKVEETKSGMTVEQPMKADEDTCDSTRMITAGSSFGPADVLPTPEQRLSALIPAGYRTEELMARVDPNQAAMTAEMAKYMAEKQLNLRKPVLLDPWGQELR